MFTIDEQIQEVQREISMRYRVYGRKVEEGKMEPEEMAKRVDCMIAVRRSLESLVPEKQASLFQEQQQEVNEYMGGYTA